MSFLKRQLFPKVNLWKFLQCLKTSEGGLWSRENPEIQLFMFVSLLGKALKKKVTRFFWYTFKLWEQATLKDGGTKHFQKYYPLKWLFGCKHAIATLKGHLWSSSSVPGLLHDLLFKTNTNFLRGKCHQFYFIDEQVQVLKD